MTSLFDTMLNWIGGGASLPKVCVPFHDPPPRLQRFGDPDGAKVRDSIIVQPPTGAEFRAPVNGMLWTVPSIVNDAAPLPPDVLPNWPTLTLIDGTALAPKRSPPVLAQNDVLLEIWPAALRRLEYVMSSLEIPPGMEDWDLPQMPAPRWFWIRGCAGLGFRLQTIANTQFLSSGIEPNIIPSGEGKTPIYVSAGDVLSLSDGSPMEIRAFDALGGVIDPDWVFQTFHIIGTDSDFERLGYVWEPTPNAPWNAPERHLMFFCDGGGTPYESRADPDALGEPGMPLPDSPLREISFPGTSAPSLPIPGHGLVVINATDPAYPLLADQLVRLELPGEHQRITLRPHGTLEKRPFASFARHSFFKVQVVDFAQWFPTSANARNRNAGDDAFARYTDGNEIVPLIDGRDTMREIYRAIRATYAVETYASDDHVPELDPDGVVGTPDPTLKTRARILLTNGWIDADTALLGRRAQLATPRTQSEQLPEMSKIVDGLRVVAALSPEGIEDVPGTGPIEEYRLWFLVSSEPLPPGTYVALRQFAYIEKARGDDPRLPDVLLNDDIYGVLGPLDPKAPTASTFVGGSRLYVLRALFKTGEPAPGELRVVTWTPDPDDPAPETLGTSGKGRKKIVASGDISLTPPPNASDAPVFTHPALAPAPAKPRLHLEFDGTLGRAIVVVKKGTLLADTIVIVVNARTSEWMAVGLHANFPDGEDQRITVEPFALRDWVLVGFPPTGSANVHDCKAFYVLRVTEEQMIAGAATGHPTEVLGALQEAIQADVDTRLLVWHASDHPPAEKIFSATGMVAALNAGVNGKRGQSIFDALNRREFGVHHQKGAFILTAKQVHEGGGAIAFLGGIDLVNNRWDISTHDAVEPDRQAAPWHDVHCRIRGRAAWDVYRNFRQRWNAALLHPELVGSDPGWTTMPPISDVSAFGPDAVQNPDTTLQRGDCTAQIMRTLSPFVPAHDSFLDPIAGDLSIRKAYRRVIDEARQFLYIEDQYYFDRDLATRMHDALLSKRLKFVILVVPKRFNDFPMGDLVTYAQRRRAIMTLLYGVSEVSPGEDPSTLPGNVSDRVVILTIKNDAEAPVYVHCKIMVADDLWFTISSANLTRRSMTYDSEIGVMAIDKRTRRGGQKLARDFRVALMAAHLGLVPEEFSLVEDPFDAFCLLKDFVAGRWPGRNTRFERSGIVEMDPLHTHYGIQPAEADGTFIDAVSALGDPDGEREELPFGLLDFQNLMAALEGATEDQVFGGLGRMRITFDVSALGTAPMVVHVTVFEVVNEAGPVFAPPVVLGTFPATATVNAGVIRSGSRYVIEAKAASAEHPEVILATKEQSSREPGETGVFLTNVAVVF